MKNLFHFQHFFKGIFFFLALSACTKQFDANTGIQNNKLQASSFMNAGLMHNAQLDIIFKEIKKSKTKSSINSYSNALDNILDPSFTRASALTIAKNISLDQIEIDQNTPANLKKMLWSQSSSIFQDIPFMDNAQLYSIQNGSKFTAAQLKFINAINVLLNDEDNVPQSLQDRISSIEASISQANLSQSEQATLYIITNTAKSSLQYWDKNIYAWAELSNNNAMFLSQVTHETSNAFAIKSHYSFSWKSVAKADVGGAVAGVAAWGGAALIGGPATLAAASASVGSWAAGCSAYEALMQVW
jgi:hypothetical protein